MSSLSYFIPAPTGGFNSRDDINYLPESECRTLVNFIPKRGSIQLRKGYETHCVGVGTGAVKTIAQFSGADGTKSLIACGDGAIYDATEYAGTPVSLASGFSEDLWQTINFKGNLILCNGVDQPKKWDGSSISDATYTGVTDENLVDVTSYKSRLYFVEKDTTKLWYGSTSAITGALTEFDVGDILKSGGFIQTVKSLSQDTGNGLEDLLVIISSEGEVLTYSGSFPGDSSFKLVGRYYIGPPIGRRCAANVATDLVILSLNGAISLSEVLKNARSEDPSHQITNKVNNTFYDYQERFGDNSGWQPFYYPKGNLFIINIPKVEDSISSQLVLNLDNGGWCEFSEINAFCWTAYDRNPYFGGSSGTIYKWDTGHLDDGIRNIQGTVETSFNYIGDKSHIKSFLMARPLFYSDQRFLVGLYTAVDFSPYSSLTAAGISGFLDYSIFDVSDWDTTDWSSGQVSISQWFSITGLGRCISLKLSGSFGGANLDINGIDIIFKIGGVL